jgi:8-oxo-dGTP pyrophosphatase MutT (NUDIX family)
VFTEVIHVYLARGLAPCDSAPEAHEVFEARWVPLSEALALAAGGKLPDARRHRPVLGWAPAARGAWRRCSIWNVMHHTAGSHIL